MSGIKIIFGLLTFVTIGMIIGALFQLAFIRRLEESAGSGFPLYRRKVHESQEKYLQLPKGFSLWEQDEETRLLRIGFVKPEIISWSPRIIIFHNFLSAEECDYLIAIARPRLQISTVVDTKTGKGIKSNVRTSSGMFLNSEERSYPLVKAIEKRISIFSQVPVENGELIQVLRYEKGQFYKPHHDYFSDVFNLKRGGQRIATMLMYLSDNVEGGETYFPMGDWVKWHFLDGICWCFLLLCFHAPLWCHHNNAGDKECNCGSKTVKGVCVNPAKGDAVLFWSMGLDGSVDPNSIHGGCEVLGGVKWSATKWMRQKTSA